MSFTNDGVDFKLFVDGEMNRVREVLGGAVEIKEIKSDSMMAEGFKLVMGKLDDLLDQEVSDNLIIEIMKLQRLAHEVTV